MLYAAWGSHQSLGSVKTCFDSYWFLDFSVGYFSLGEGSACKPFQEFQPLSLEYGPHHRSLISFPECLKAEPLRKAKLPKLGFLEKFFFSKTGQSLQNLLRPVDS